MSRYTRLTLTIEGKRNRSAEIIRQLGEQFKPSLTEKRDGLSVVVLSTKYTKASLAKIREVAGKLTNRKEISHMYVRQEAVNPADSVTMRLVG